MPRVSRDDAGAVAVIVALLVGSVLLGVGALVVDVGGLQGERRQLQNGADAAALAVAQSCAPPGPCDATTSPTGTAATYAGSNDGHDGKAGIDIVCGTAPGLLSCPSKQGAWDCTDQLGTLGAAPYVQVQTSTRTGSGGTLLPPVLSRALSGRSGYPGTAVRACARASFGTPSSLRSPIPLTISLCELQKYTSTGLSPGPPYPLMYVGEKTIYFHGDKAASGCPSGPSGADLPGGFGWLATGEGCVATTDTTTWVPDSTGVSVPKACTDADLSSLVGQVVDIPVFDQTNGLTGSNGSYHIVAYAAFYLTGYRFPSTQQKSILTHAFPCKGPDTCISGVFTLDITPPNGTIGTGPYVGVTVIQMSG